jgi:L-lactate utilization protein LutB
LVYSNILKGGKVTNKTTITEALQEIKTINKRLAGKRQSLQNYIARDSQMKDPLEREGGSVEFIKKERQAIGDLETRIVDIRTAIQHANLNTMLQLGDRKSSVAEWLTWRREVAPGTQAMLTGLSRQIQLIRDSATRKGGKVISAQEEGGAKQGEIVVHLNEKELLEQSEQMETVLGELDGKLSLINATTVIEF